MHAGKEAGPRSDLVEDRRHCLCAGLGKMAEAAAVPPHRFFCHCCKGEVNPKLPVRRLSFNVDCMSSYLLG